MLIILEGTSGQESAVDAFDIGSIFPAAQKGEGAASIPVLGVSMIQIKGGGTIVVKEGVRSLAERVNAARAQAALLASGHAEPGPLTDRATAAVILKSGGMLSDAEPRKLL